MRIFVDLDDTVADFRSAYLRAKQIQPEVESPHQFPVSS